MRDNYRKTPYLPRRSGASLQMPRNAPIAIERKRLSKVRQYTKSPRGFMFQCQRPYQHNTDQGALHTKGSVAGVPSLDHPLLLTRKLRGHTAASKIAPRIQKREPKTVRGSGQAAF